MKQNSLENLLQQDAPPPDPAARLAARRAALAEFAKVNPAQPISPTMAAAPERRGLFQALLGALRPSRDTNDHGRDSMPLFSRKALYGGVASIAIALVGSTVVWNTFRQNELTAATDAGETRAAPAYTDAGARIDAGATAASKPADVAGSVEPATATPVAPDAENGEAFARERAERAKIELAKQRDDASRQQGASEERKNEAGAAASTPLIAKDDLSQLKEKDEQVEEVVVTGQKMAPQVMESRTPVTTINSEPMDEISVTPSSRGPATPHKGVAAPVRGSGSGRLFARAEAPAAPPVPPPSDAYGYNKPSQPEGNDKFQHFELNSIKQPAIESERVSTFSADVDTSSYSFVRKQLDQGRLPQKDAVRAEEMINYFDYAWPAAESREQPFRPTIVVSDSPWGKGRKLIHIGIKGYELPANKRPDANIVMLLDVSGSMDSPDKLPLVKQSMKLLLGSLKPTDTVGIVVYAGAAGLVLPPTPAGEREKIAAAIDSLTPGGSTAGAEGIELAYQLAEKSFRKEGVNRILLCTDGDFNVGIAGTEELKGYVERKRATGIFLSVLGFGQGNYRDELAQALAQNGNGVAAYIDSVNEAQKVLVQQASSSLFTIAKDVKFQVEFNPATVAEYRLIGYETRALKTEDFNNDKIDAGDIGAGHTVTAIYEITPVGAENRMIGGSRYVKPPELKGNVNEYGFLQMRYKLPNQDTSTLITQPIAIESGKGSEAIQRDVGFSTAVAGFAQMLRGGQFTGKLSYDDIIKQALATRGEDPYGYRNEFVQLVRKAQSARGM
jgi:Ca-activated chloride channel family protein